MQTFRALFDGNGAGLQTPSLNSFLEFPQNLLQRASVSQAGGQATDRQKVGQAFADQGSQFSLRFEPRSEGGAGGIWQTGVLAAATYSPSAGGAPLPIRCRWSRRIGMHEVEVPGIEGDQYYLSADDIGTEVVCHATSAEGAPRGGGAGVIGPVALDPSTRMSLEQLVASGVGPFPVRHHRSLDDTHPRDVMIRVTPEQVRVVHPGSARGGGDATACYCADYPKVVLHPASQQSFTLELSGDPEHSYHFVALSRCSRDLIALLIRAFHSRQYVALTYLLSQLTQNPAAPGARLSVPKESMEYDVPALGGRIAKELHRTVGQLLLLARHSRNAEKEKLELQEQLRETIQSYTEAIEKMHQQVASAGGGPAGSLRLQLHDARAVYSQLQLEMQELKPQLEEAQLLVSGAGPLAASGEHAAEVAALRGDISNLRSSIAALSSTSRGTGVRAVELQGLRQDIEVLTREKDELQRCAKKAGADKKDLIENFLYIKGCLDKLQMASLQAPPSQPDVERELAQVKTAYDQAVDERNRFSVRLEALERDREQQKGSRESAVERMMTVNSRLIEERGNLEKDKARISELYSRTVGAAQPGGTTPATSGYPGLAAPSAEGAAKAIEALQAELAQKAAMLDEKQRETDSLRQRLRKLATV